MTNVKKEVEVEMLPMIPAQHQPDLILVYGLKSVESVSGRDLDEGNAAKVALVRAGGGPSDDGEVVAEKRETVEEHLVMRGFANHYKIWTDHGEVNHGEGQGEGNTPLNDVDNRDPVNEVEVDRMPELVNDVLRNRLQDDPWTKAVKFEKRPFLHFAATERPNWSRRELIDLDDLHLLVALAISLLLVCLVQLSLTCFQLASLAFAIQANKRFAYLALDIPNLGVLKPWFCRARFSLGGDALQWHVNVFVDGGHIFDLRRSKPIIFLVWSIIEQLLCYAIPVKVELHRIVGCSECNGPFDQSKQRFSSGIDAMNLLFKL
ncbi:hypothetical protein RJ639_023247 [Escallonia herrerae]|uniref:Transposase-associated domain-containing protein n=1 Tax=Escallonia herrerae TaxID=1293975 RepID=A0AA88V243_9ASTE|nr:hypothetical protein RJ639_023247 [Escallonia herrerae]